MEYASREMGEFVHFIQLLDVTLDVMLEGPSGNDLHLSYLILLNKKFILYH